MIFCSASLISGDVTVATWGGSTADNLESIEENHSNTGQEPDQQHVSDGRLGGGGFSICLLFNYCQTTRSLF